MIGKVLGGRYEIIEEVGKGGMAQVFKAQCNVLNRTVAVKLLRNDLEGGDEFINRFKAEARAAACLAHPNIVSVYDVGEEDGLYYIVMEYIEGTTLKEYIKQKGKLSSLESADITSQICSALSVAHANNVIHRDIKPHNIMITNNNLVKVTDFGIARASNSSTMRVGDFILGSVHYISPEQARGGYVDCRSDIYSLGIVLYEMLTGKVPFESESPIAVAMKHLEEIPVNPATLSPDISLELQEVVLKAISKETRKRYQSVEAFKTDLDAIITKLKTVADLPDDEADDEYLPEDEYLDEDFEEIADDSDYEEEDDEAEVYPKKHSALNIIIAAVLIALVVVGGGFFGALYFINPDAPIFLFFKDNDVDVPEFTKMQYEEAQKLASKSGLVLEIGDKMPGPEADGTVIYQSISQGVSVKKGTFVTVHLSTGPENINTASYRGLSADVIDSFEENGYDVEVKYKSDSEIDKDKIISLVQKGNKIIFTVSTGSGEIDCVVPNLLRQTKAKARALLEENGLLLNEKVSYIESNSVEPGLVVEQSVSPGEKVSPKTKISIILAADSEDENIDNKKDDKKDNESKEEKDNSDTTGNSENKNAEADNKSDKAEETSTEPFNENNESAPAEQLKDKTLFYSTENLSAPTSVKIVETSSDGSTKIVFEQTVDPSLIPEIVVKVRGSGVNEYSIYHDGSLALKTNINFE